MSGLQQDLRRLGLLSAPRILRGPSCLLGLPRRRNSAASSSLPNLRGPMHNWDLFGRLDRTNSSLAETLRAFACSKSSGPSDRVDRLGRLACGAERVASCLHDWTSY